MKLVLVRHAQSLDNAELGVAGAGGSGLSDRGKRQAKELARMLAREKIAAVYSSPLQRALETAEALGRPVEVAEELREVNLGRLEGLAHEEMEKRFPGMIERMFVEPRYRIPGGETILEVHDRIMPFVHRLKKKHGGQAVVLVAHNVVNRVITASLLGLPLGNCRNVKQKNAAVTVFYLEKGRKQLYELDNTIHYVK
ncbi:MAG: histidine phosphatase family protein [Candidatus Micrarchaeota archaeon]